MKNQLKWGVKISILMFDLLACLSVHNSIDFDKAEERERWLGGIFLPFLWQYLIRSLKHMYMALEISRRHQIFVNKIRWLAIFFNHEL